MDNKFFSLEDEERKVKMEGKITFAAGSRPDSSAAIWR